MNKCKKPELKQIPQYYKLAVSKRKHFLMILHYPIIYPKQHPKVLNLNLNQ